MWIIPKDGRTPSEIAGRLAAALMASRFTARVACETFGTRTPGVKITCVRLKRKKDYCGAHPGPCLALRRKHMRSFYLEGLDWVGFNHLLNDLLDDMGAAADVFSYNREANCNGKYFVRRGRLRRTGYPWRMGDRASLWTQTRDDFGPMFEDHAGKPHPPVDEEVRDSDTPGFPCYTLAEEAKYREAWQEAGHE